MNKIIIALIAIVVLMGGYFIYQEYFAYEPSYYSPSLETEERKATQPEAIKDKTIPEQQRKIEETKPRLPSMREALKKKVSVDIDKSPRNQPLTVQYAVIAICEAAGVPYQWQKSSQLASPECRRFIAPVHIRDVTAEKALLDILTPVGLKFEVDDKGLYLCK